MAWTAKTAPTSALGKALYYLWKQGPYLILYLGDSRLKLANNSKTITEMLTAISMPEH